MKAIFSLLFLPTLLFSSLYGQRRHNETSSDDVFFMLFTRENPIIGQRIGFDAHSIIRSNWNSAYDVRILVHGYVSSYAVAENIATTEQFLRRSDYNVIAVDWSVLAGGTYEEAMEHIPYVGSVIGTFIDFLFQHGFTQHRKVNLIGHSFGSHVAGFAGKTTKYGKINAIFATDPSVRFGSFEDPSGRLDFTDAEYVESIVTSTRGWQRPIAHATFYPNWGLTQPGCNFFDLCDHHRATELYAESVNSERLLARQCENREEIEAQSCPGNGVVASLGGDFAKTIRGVFFLETNAESPFALG